MNDGALVAVRFNDCINAGDVEGLAQLMSEDHRFIDTAGTVVVGRTACLAAWRGFFAAYPGYRNVFEAVSASGTNVTAAGYSMCPNHPVLEGPALWTAVVDGNQVLEWRVYEDSAAVRRRLGILGD